MGKSISVEDQTQALLAAAQAKALIERAGGAMVAACRLMGHKRPASAIKLLNRGWDRMNDLIIETASPEAMSAFMARYDEEVARVTAEFQDAAATEEEATDE